jgi:hypothetical protein
MPRPSVGSKDITLDKRTKILLGVLAAVILVGAGAFFLLSGKSSSDDTANTPVTPVPAATASAAPSASATPKPAATPVPSEVAAGVGIRDPFAPLTGEAAAKASAAASATPTAAASASPSAVATGTPTRTP